MIIFHLFYDLLMAGIETMLVNIANEQVRMGHQVKLLILNDAIDESLRKSLDAKIEMVCFGKKRKAKNIIPVLKLNAYLYTHKFDMLHIHNPRLSRFIKTPIDQQHKCCTQHCLCNGALDSDFLHNFEHAFAISDAVRNDIKEKYNQNATTIYNGITVSAFKSDSTKKNVDGKFHIVQVGRFNIAVKGQDIPVNALSKLKGKVSKEIVLDFIGDNSGKDGDVIKRLAEDLKVSDSINFLGLQNQEYIAEHLCEYDLFLQPSRKEGFGLTVAEAMAAKVPVLVSDVPGPMDVISNGEYGFYFKSEDVDDCADKILSIINGEYDLSRITESSFHRVFDKFDVSATARQYVDKYVEIIGDTGLAGGGQIVAKNHLCNRIRLDFLAYKMEHPLAARFTYGENWELFSYMKNLRYLEYYMNKPRKYPWDKVLRSWHWLKHRRNCKRMDIFVSPNSVGPGFHLVHRGFRHVLSGTKIGTNCEILPMVLMGKKHPDLKEWQITIGDNCYISTGVTILGPITIGNNVTIAAGAVVTKDIPSNCTVAGVPAKIIKKNP